MSSRARILLRSSLTLVALVAAQPGHTEICDPLKKQVSTRNGISAFLQQETERDVICAIALMPDGQDSSYCYAIFDYRSPKARDAFERLNTNLSTCFTVQAQDGTGSIVNHPDSFDQHQFCAPGALLSLSLKDKGNLNQTLVFLRLDGAASANGACGQAKSSKK